MANPTPEEFQRLLTLENIFQPWASERRRLVYGSPQSGENPVGRFVHYTSAENALKIITDKCIWMRNATCMADYREVQHGFDSLLRFFSNQEKKKAFIEALEPCYSGVAVEAIGRFDQWWNHIQLNTFITSISEHDKSEDINGRLSMWRAFGRNIGRVAFVLNVPWKSDVGDSLKIMFGPVGYPTEDEIQSQLLQVIENIKTNGDLIRTIDRSMVIGSVFNMLLSSVVCLKHPGFHEEKEWRVIYCPKFHESSAMDSSPEVVGGIPQTVYKIPLDGKLSPDLEISRLLDRLIIGPSPYPWAMHEAFTAVLKEAGVPDAEKRVFVSNIPIRS
jgi:hypothetical protein